MAAKRWLRRAIAALLVCCCWWPIMAQETRPANGEPGSKGQDKSAGLTYSVVRIRGTIGRDFTAKAMQRAIEWARSSKATVLVLELDTSGGSVAAAEQIVDAIIDAKDVRFVAFVRKALSAGVPVTLACKEITVIDAATIGAAVSYVVDEHGLPAALPDDAAEKMQSAWRAVCRKAAQHGGHDSLIAEAMVDPDFALTMRKEGNRILVERDGTGEVLKAKGRILTLTASEAVSCGLAAAMVRDLPELGRRLGLPESTIPHDEETDAISDTINKAFGAEQAGDHEKAEKLLRDLCSAHKANPNAWLAYAVVLNRQKNHSLALVAAQTAIRLSPELAEAHMEVGRAESGVKHFAEAVDAFKKALGMRPDWADAYYEMGRAYESWQIHQGSYTIPRIGATGEQERTMTMLLEKRHDVEAEAAYKAAVTLDPKHLPALKALAAIQPKVHKGDEAKQTQARISELERPQQEPPPEERSPMPVRIPDDPETAARKKVSLARMYIDNNMPEKAAQILRQVVRDYPDTSAAARARELLEPTTQPKG